MAIKKSEKTKRSLRWSVGLFRNASGKLVAAYVNAEGEPMPYEQARVGAKRALFFAVYYLNPPYVMLLFTEELGRKMIATAAVLQILGAIAIKKIVNIKI